MQRGGETPFRRKRLVYQHDKHKMYARGRDRTKVEASSSPKSPHGVGGGENISPPRTS
jgi:hypothetical protein